MIIRVTPLINVHIITIKRELKKNKIYNLFFNKIFKLKNIVSNITKTDNGNDVLSLLKALISNRSPCEISRFTKIGAIIKKKVKLIFIWLNFIFKKLVINKK